MLAERITWISEPTTEDKKYYKRFGFWPKYMLRQFTTVDGKTTYYMNEDQYKIYLAELELLELINKFPNKHELIKSIENYGDRREEKGRQDVEDDWAEADAGGSL